MTSYLEQGWFEQQDGKRGLAAPVIDGAMDVAGGLLRGGIEPLLLMKLALRVRGLAAIADPQMRGAGQFTERDRGTLTRRLEKYMDRDPAVHAFVADCLDRVNNLSDLMAFYLHVVHVARMMQLLQVAAQTPLAALLGGAAPSRSVTTKPGVARPAATKPAATKSGATKPATAKPATAKPRAKTTPAPARRPTKPTTSRGKK